MIVSADIKAWQEKHKKKRIVFFLFQKKNLHFPSFIFGAYTCLRRIFVYFSSILCLSIAFQF